MIRFIRRAGRIIPIKAKNALSSRKSGGNVLAFKKPKKKSSFKRNGSASIPDVGFAVVGSIAIGTASTRLRQLIAKRASNNKSKSLGNPLINIGADGAIAGAGISLAAKKSKSFKAGLNLLLKRRI